MRLGLWRCTFDDDAGTTHPAVFVFDIPEPVLTLVRETLYSSRDDLRRDYPGADDLKTMGDALLVQVPEVTDDEWLVSTEAEKVGIIHATLDKHEVRS